MGAVVKHYRYISPCQPLGSVTQMSLQQFFEFLKTNLTGAHDKFKCLHYLEAQQNLTPMEREYARGMVDRWISVGMFSGTLSGCVGPKRKGSGVDADCKKQKR